MTQKIHPTAIIEDGASIGKEVEIGSYSIIGKNVKIGDKTIIKSHVVIEGITTIGEKNTIFSFAAIGQEPQDLKYKGEKSEVIIGNNNTIREYVTIQSGTKDGGMITKVGNNCLLMISTHIAHDCIIGNNVIMANNATLAGHVIIEDNVVVGGLSAVHQFVRIGKSAMIGGLSGVAEDIIPYGTAAAQRASLIGLNLVGLKRLGVEKDSIHCLRNFYKKLFNKENGNIKENLQSLIKEYENDPLVKDIINFLQAENSRSICTPKDK